MKLPFKGSLYSDIAAIFDVVRIYPTVILNGGPTTYWAFMFLPLALTFIYIIQVIALD